MISNNIIANSKLTDVIFDFEYESNANCTDYKIKIKNPMAYDTETSNGYYDPRTGAIVPFISDPSKYTVEVPGGRMDPNTGYIAPLISLNYDEQMIQHMGDPDYIHPIDTFEKVGITYIHIFAIGDRQGVHTFLMRTFDEFEQFIKDLDREIMRQLSYGYCKDPQLIQKQYTNLPYSHVQKTPKGFIYVHNFGFDFQSGLRNTGLKFRAKRKKADPVFARKPHKPMKATILPVYNELEFRDTLCLAQRSLKTWLEDENIPIKKLTGDLDYDLIRTPNTPLTDKELGYCVNDVAGLVLVMSKYADKFGGLDKIPLTQTGIVRNRCIETVKEGWKKSQSQIMQNMTYSDFKELNQLFLGGWTHGNAHKAGKTWKGIRCFDFASSYPYVMTTMKYPVEQFTKRDPAKYWKKYKHEDPQDLDRNECFYVKVRFTNIKTKLNNTFWSGSRCLELKNPTLDNGKIAKADAMTTYMTDLDYNTFIRAYDCDEEILELKTAKCDFLPRELILLILDQYKQKTNYKDVAGKESLYKVSKEFVNSIYGCAVTNYIGDIVQYLDDKGWIKQTFKEFEAFDQEVAEERYSHIVRAAYTKDRTFLSYQIGCWITAHARYNLWSLILQLDEHVLYGDTDSLKGQFDDHDLAIIEEYNENVLKRQEEVAKRLNFDPDLYRPRKPKPNGDPGGDPAILGIFDRESDCLEFRTLGAKRYCYTVINKKGEVELKTTVAGIPKKNGAAKFDNVDDFEPDTGWTTQESGKKILKYIDEQPRMHWVDYKGNHYDSDQMYSVVITPTTFKMSMDSYLEYMTRILGRRDLTK